MQTQLQTQQQIATPIIVKQLTKLFESDRYKNRMAEILGGRAQTFMTSVIQIASSNTLLHNCDAQSIVNSALVATTLDLPINSQLGLAYIVPFKEKQPDGTFARKATLQLGYRAFLQLAQRSGQFQKINVVKAYDGDTEDDIRQRLLSLMPRAGKGQIVGYVAYFKLLNGYEDSLFMSNEDLLAHAKKYSQTYKSTKSGLWATDFEAMATKTVLKLLLSKKAPLSIEMQKAQISDQAVITNYDGETIDAEYIDNTNNNTDTLDISDSDKKKFQMEDILKNINTIEDLDLFEETADSLSEDEKKLIDNKRKKLTKK